MAHYPATDVDSPRNHWKLERVVLDRGEGRGVYCLGYWDAQPVIGFRWNGGDATPKGNPVSRGYPTWVVLAEEDYPVLVNIFPSGMQAEIRRFLRLK
ncbi:MAG: hypothetical protein WAO58_09995 [Fimbriimonadaceae bacterium]